MLTNEAVEQSMREVRELLRADGADLDLVSIRGNDAYVELALRFDEVDCLECVMPKDFIERIALDSMRRSLPSLVAIHITDPRETDLRETDLRETGPGGAGDGT